MSKGMVEVEVYELWCQTYRVPADSLEEGLVKCLAQEDVQPVGESRLIDSHWEEMSQPVLLDGDKLNLIDPDVPVEWIGIGEAKIPGIRDVRWAK